MLLLILLLLNLLCHRVHMLFCLDLFLLILMLFVFLLVVEVLTAGEEGGASGSCQKNVPSIMRADCDGDGKFESTFAIITTYSCEGDGSGPCKSGTVSTTYDCEGYVTGYSDLTLDMNC